MFVALDSDARLKAHSDYPEPRLHISVQQLEHYALLVVDKGKVFLGTVQRCRDAGDWSKCGSHVDVPPQSCDH
jgi:hypothetical protein